MYDLEGLTMIFKESKDVTPTAGDVDIESSVKAIRVGVAGDVTVLLSKDAAPVTFKNVSPGESTFSLVRVKKILQAGTTAENIIALS